MGALSFWHFILILIIILVFFGPSRLPSLGKSMGEAIRGFKKGLNDDSIDVTDTSNQAQLRQNNEQAQQKQTKKDKHEV